MKKPDHQTIEAELLAGAPPEAEDSETYNEQQTRAARKAGGIMDADEDFRALHRLVSGANGLDKDADVGELRRLVNDHNRARLHKALDKVLNGIRERRCAGDRAFLRRVGISR